MPLRLLSIAVASGRAGAVFFIGGELKGWCQSTCAAKNPEQTAQWTENLFKSLRPQLVITEDRGSKCRKGEAARTAIEVVEFVADRTGIDRSAIVRTKRYANKYEEAEELAEQFPDLAPWRPSPRKCWDAEPRSTVLFEALSMAADVLDIRTK